MPKWLTAFWLSIADAFDDVFLFPTSQDRKFRWLCEAIAARRPLSFDYRGGRRTVEPFCLGLVQPGRRRNVSLLCYQTGGYAELAAEVGWKLYRAWDIEDPAAGGEEFPGDRPGYDPDRLPMYRVYCRVEPLRRWEGPPAESIEAFLRGDEGGSEREAAEPGHNDLMRRFRSHHPEETPPQNTEPAPPHVAPAPRNLPEES
jgi:hypothetical protein